MAGCLRSHSPSLCAGLRAQVSDKRGAAGQAIDKANALASQKYAAPAPAAAAGTHLLHLCMFYFLLSIRTYARASLQTQ